LVFYLKINSSVLYIDNTHKYQMIRSVAIETINNGTFAHGYTISKLSLINILIYRSKCGFILATISLIKPFRQWYNLFFK